MRRSLGLVMIGLIFTAASPPAVAQSPNKTGRYYVRMSDGVELSVYLSFPKGYDGERLPAIFVFDGYAGGGGPPQGPGGFSFRGYRFIDWDNYVVVHAGIRGAGCSGGRFSLFSERSSEDGAELIEWIARQRWSNGNVGMVGHSYSGITALLVAGQRPPHLRAISVSGVLEDMYRDVIWPGGIGNKFFPFGWWTVRQIVEPEVAIEAASQGDPRCLQHIANRTPESPFDSLLTNALAPEDNDWYYSRSPRAIVDRIEVPVQLHGNYQDEQTLARGTALIFEELDVTHKQLLLTNGNHGFMTDDGDRQYVNSVITRARGMWIDRFVGRIDNGIDAQPRVRVLLESHFDGKTADHTGEVHSNQFPLQQTEWERLYGGGDGSLTTSPPTGSDSTMFLSGLGRRVKDPGASHSGDGTYEGQGIWWSEGPDAVYYRTHPANRTRVVVGPMMATLYARVFGRDAEIYVQVADEGKNGELSLLQRGMLKVSHRAVDREDSWFDKGVMYRPWHPHTGTKSHMLTPGEIVRLDVEIWPVGFTVRPGHKLVFIVTSPPVMEGFDVWQIDSGPVPIELLHDKKHPTNFLVPFVPPPKDLEKAVPCGEQVAVWCD
jgi:putative CocE/NonD family hydrolase